MRGFNRENHFVSKNGLLLKKSFFKDLPYVTTVYGSEYGYLFYKLLNPTFAIDKKVLRRLIKLSSKMDYTKNELLHLLIERDILELKCKLKAIKSQNLKLKSII